MSYLVSMGLTPKLSEYAEVAKIASSTNTGVFDEIRLINPDFAAHKEDLLFIMNGYAPFGDDHFGIVWGRTFAYSYKSATSGGVIELHPIISTNDLDTPFRDFSIKVMEWDLNYLRTVSSRSGEMDGWRFVASKIVCTPGGIKTETASFHKFI